MACLLSHLETFPERPSEILQSYHSQRADYTIMRQNLPRTLRARLTYKERLLHSTTVCGNRIHGFQRWAPVERELSDERYLLPCLATGPKRLRKVRKVLDSTTSTKIDSRVTH
jgi:hypothetical protein